MDNNTITVPPSGDTTGKADTESINDAIQMASRVNGGGVVELSGRYTTCGPIVLGTSGRCSIHGDGHTRITYNGPQSSEYMVRAIGVGDYTPRDLIRGIALDSQYRCRGVLLLSQWYFQSVSQVLVHRAKEIGLDVVECYGSRVSDIHISNTLGMAMRTSGSQASVFDTIRVSNTMTAHNPLSDSSPSIMEIMLFEAVNGRDAAKEKFGKSYAETWPSEEDATVVGEGGAPIRTSKQHRGVVSVDSSCTELSNLIIEGNYAGEVPLIAFCGNNYGQSIRRAWIESNVCGFEKVLLSPPNTAESKMSNVSISDVFVCDLMDYRVQCDTFMRATGRVSDVNVDGLRASGLKNHVFVADGCECSNLHLTGIRTGLSTIPGRAFTKSRNGGEITQARLIGLDSN